MKAFEVEYRELPYPHKKSPGYIQKHQVFVNTLLKALCLFTRNSALHSESAISSRVNLPYFSYGISKFFEKLQS